MTSLSQWYMPINANPIRFPTVLLVRLVLLVLLGPSPGRAGLRMVKDRWKSHLAQSVLSIDHVFSTALASVTSPAGPPEGLPSGPRHRHSRLTWRASLIFTNFEPKAPCSSYFWYPHVVGYMSYMSYFINDHQVCLIPKLRLVSCPSWWFHIQSEPRMNMFTFYSFSCFPKH